MKQASWIVGWAALVCIGLGIARAEERECQFGYAERDITPELNQERPVWLAGYAAGRRATGVHDPLKVRAVVLQIGTERIAIAAADLIGLQIDATTRIRQALPGYRHVTIHSTHNHEGPDVIGIWGKTIFQRGVDPAYIDLVVAQTVAAVEEAARSLESVTATFGTAEDATLLEDRRLPDVRDGTLRAIGFRKQSSEPSSLAGMPQPLAGIIVQWNCHPETLGADNTLITADFPAVTIAALRQKYACPVLYVTGTVGGLMAPPANRLRNAAGNVLAEGEFAYCQAYGEEVAKLAERALHGATPLRLESPVVATEQVALHVENRLYRLARQFGVLHRAGFAWQGDPFAWGEKIVENEPGTPVAVLSEVSYLRLGQLHWVNMPGEIYPELVYGKPTAAVDPGADFPDAEPEPTVAQLVSQPHWILCGLANDEIGYIIPRRQWDAVEPYCFDLERAQYGEVNSCGPATAPAIMQALQRCLKKVQQPDLATSE